jgi:polygalacturonase/PKD repeat protein
MANQTLNKKYYIRSGRSRHYTLIASWSNVCIVLFCLAFIPWAHADPPLPVISNQVFVVTNSIYGAIGDGLTNNAAAIQAAINDASTNGGGIVEIPADGTLSIYLSGPINLASGINLQIDNGAMLQMLPRNVTTNGLTIIPKWPSASTPFILGNTLTDVAITGSGIIDGQGTNWWFPKASTRPNFIQFTHCTRILMQDVTLQNPPTFHIMAKNSNVSMTLQGLNINTPASSPNTDGMDLASTNVLIRNCFISVGDDNLEIGGSSAAAADITVSNCTFGAGHGVSLGSLVNGAGSGVHDLIVSNCFFNGTRNGIHMKSDRDIGGVVQNLQYLDITMTNVSYPIAMYSYYDSIGAPSTFNISPFMASTDTVQAITSTTPIWRNITISNLTVFSTSGKNIVGLIWGLPEMLVSNVTLYHVNIFAPTKSFDIYNAQGIQIIDSNLSAPNTTTNTLTLFNAQVVISNTIANTNLMTLGGLSAPPTNNVLTFVNGLAAVADARVLGGGTLTLDGSTLALKQDSVIFSNALAILSDSTLGVTSGTNIYTGALSGSGPLTFQAGNGRLSFQGDVSGYSGDATVLNGTLLLDNTNGIGTGTVTIASTGTLGSSGTINGPVTVNGILAPGDSPGTLTINNNLLINSSGVVQYELGTNSDLTIVSGNLALDGTLNIADAGGLTNGVYPLFTYGGTLTTNGSPGVLALGTVANPSFFSYAVDIGNVGTVRLVVSFAVPVAGFSADTTSGTLPLTVTFTDLSTGSITNRFWDFGDEGTTNTQATSVAHTYNTTGNYTVELVVSGPGGVSTNTQPNYIAVACGYTLSTTNAGFSDVGGTGTVTVVTTAGCSWTAASNDSWIQITGGSVSATGSATVAYTILPNASSTSRTGTMTIASQTFTVSQSGDSSAPVVVLIAPTSGIVSGNVAVSATAVDDIAVVKVEFYRDNSVLLGTVTTPPDNVSFDTTTVSDGSHCFFAKAYDLAGNVSATASNCVTVDNRAPSAALELIATTVATNQINLSWNASNDNGGSGVASYRVFRDGEQIGTTANTTYFDIGLAAKTVYCYKVAAQDELGHVSAQSADACSQTFVTTVPAVGKYNGLVIQTNAPSQASSGSIKLTVSRHGPFAASLTVGGVRSAFKGQFDISGNATNTVVRKGSNSLQVILHLDLADDPDQITGIISDGSFTSEVLADRDVFSAMARCPLAGTYTVVLQPPEGNDPSIPEGFGYGTLTVTSTGLGRMIGFLADGAKISVSVPLSKHGTWPLYEALYKNQGACIGWVTFGTNSSVGATVDWFRPPLSSSPFFPSGFSTNVTLSGERYVSPANGGPGIAITNVVTLGGGNLIGSIVETVQVSEVGSVFVSPPNTQNLQLKLQPATGQFRGSFTHPVLNKTVNFNGLVLQLDGTGSGYFLGNSASGFVVFESSP